MPTKEKPTIEDVDVVLNQMSGPAKAGDTVPCGGCDGTGYRYHKENLDVDHDVYKRVTAHVCTICDGTGVQKIVYEAPD